MVAVDGDVQASSAAPYSESPFDDPINLAFNVDELVEGLRIAVARGDWLNVAFAASGILQAIDDAAAGTSSMPGRMATSATKGSSRVGRWVFAVLRLWRSVHPGRRRRWEIARVRQLLVAIGIDAAARVGELRTGEPREEGDIDVLVSKLRQYVEHLPEAWRHATTRIPSCFRSFDQHPADLDALAERFSRDVGDLTRPIVVAGVRTSGSYLAPFLAAGLQRLGHSDVALISVRSDQPLSSDDAHVLRRYAARNAKVLVTDDPPSSGYALASVGRSLESYGIPEASVHLALALFSDESSLPSSLAGYTATVLPFADWNIHDRLSPKALGDVVEELLHPVVVKDCIVFPLSKDGGRSHQSARLALTVEDRYGVHDLTLLVEGVGLGYFGDHDRAVSERLGSTPPDVIGVRDGLLFREWLPADAIKTPSVDDVVDYIERRSSAFREPNDRSLDMAGSQPVWEVASEQIARVYGRFWPLARLLFVDRLVKTLVRADRLAVPDGAMQAERWFTIDGDVRKVDVSTRTFGNLDLQTFDPAYDAVAFAVDHSDDHESVRREFSRRIETLSNEKWLLYELVRLWDDHRLHVIDSYESANGKGEALRRYLSNVLMYDIEPSVVGPLVALDVDGVIESEVFGFKAPSPSSVLAIRALVQHGYRPVVVSGRCVDDVRQLVSKFRMTAGVAEYGSALVLPDGTDASLLSGAQEEMLAALRGRLRRADNVRVDERYRHIVRASSLHGGNAVSLDSDVVASVLTPDFEIYDGVLQTDIVVSGVNKGRGARQLMEMLGDHQLALAVGDTVADIPLLQCADKRGVPAHASADVQQHANVKTKQPYQAGLLEIVSSFLGHEAGSCATCAAPVMSDQTKAVLALLRTTESSRPAVGVRTLRAMFAARKVNRSSR
jgi:hypothetical protein